MRQNFVLILKVFALAVFAAWLYIFAINLRFDPPAIPPQELVERNGERKIVTFEECADATGSLILDLLPPKCMTEDGVLFTSWQEAGQFCAQVITPARNPKTGETRDFPTPCDVPEEWKPVR